MTVEIEYEPADFGDEGLLRVFHLENDVWLDRTLNLDTQNHLIVAQATHLSQFVLVAPPSVPTAPVLEVAGFDLAGAFSFLVHGDPGTYQIQSSSDLLEWVEAGTVTIGLGPAEFTDPTASHGGSRFYRAVWTE